MSDKKKIVWRWDWGCYMPFCPYCDEIIGSLQFFEEVGATVKCDFCKKECDYVEPKHKARTVEVGTYTVIQTTGKSVYILDENGKWIFHAQCTKELTEDDLRDLAKPWLLSRGYDLGIV